MPLLSQLNYLSSILHLITAWFSLQEIKIRFPKKVFSTSTVTEGRHYGVSLPCWPCTCWWCRHSSDSTRCACPGGPEPARSDWQCAFCSRLLHPNKNNFKNILLPSWDILPTFEINNRQITLLLILYFIVSNPLTELCPCVWEQDQLLPITITRQDIKDCFVKMIILDVVTLVIEKSSLT